MSKTKEKWESRSLKTTEIILDAQNPRIDANPKSTQEELRALLLDTEDIEKLAGNIIKTRGNMAGERIIAIHEGGRYVVLEGNRRVTACQLILNEKLIPPGHHNKFPKTGDPDIRAAISQLEADIAPSRDAAEPIITRRHNEPGIKGWSPIAQQRRIVNMFSQGKDVETIADHFSMGKGKVLSLLKDYHVLNHVRQLKGWNKVERDLLSSSKLTTNPFTRFFTLDGVKETVGLKFNSKGELEPSIERSTFDKAMVGIARALLIPDPKTGKPPFDTRAKPKDVFQSVISKDKSLEKEIRYKPRKGGKIRPKSRAADKFFETLCCPLSDQRLLVISKEISEIEYKRFPTAAAFLVRALVESTLDWCITKYGLDKTLKKEFYTTFPHKGRFEPGLDFKTRFCISHSSTIFSSDRPKGILDHWLRQHKDYIDLVIHGKWAQATPLQLENIAGVTRNFIENVFNGTALQ